MDRMEICIVLPGYLEALTERGGGREERLVEVARRLSNQFGIVILSPFFGEYHGVTMMKPGLSLNSLYFPANAEYPSKTWFTKLMNLLCNSVYASEAALKIIQLKKAGLKVIVVADIVGNTLPAIMAKSMRVKVVFYEGNLTPWVSPCVASARLNISQTFLRAFEILLGRLLCSLSDSLIVNDGLIKEGMIDCGVEGRKISVIRGAVNTESFKPMRKLHPESEFSVGFIGRLTDEKGASLLLTVCENAVEKIPNARFTIIGDGPYAKRLRLLKNVKHVGVVRHSSLCRFLSQIDAILSFQGTFGMGEIEAFSCGKPIIACKIGEMPKLVEKKETGLVCEPNVDSCLDAISMLAFDRSLLLRLSEKARQEAVNEYDWSVAYDKWKSVIVDSVQPRGIQ